MLRRLLMAVAVLIASMAYVTTEARAEITVSAGGDITLTEGQSAVVNFIKKGQGRAKFSFETVAGTAVPDVDFQPVSGTLSPSGSMSVTVPTNNDTDYEPPKTFRVLIKSLSASTRILDADTVVTILSDDPKPPTPIQCNDGSTVIPPAVCPPTPPVCDPATSMVVDGKCVPATWCAGGIQVPVPQPCPPPPPQPIHCDDGSMVTPPATCPEPPVPPISGDVPSPSLDGAVPIADNFDTAKGLKPAGLPGTAAPDVVGAFRFICGFAGVGKFDPIVYPGDRTGKSHGHQFFGNTAINPDSNYDTLRVNGSSSCGNYDEYPLNRSAYWRPWLEDGKGNILQGDFAAIYYKRRPLSDPACTDPANVAYMGICVELPNGLRFIFGYDMVTGTAKTGSFDFICADQQGSTVHGPWATLAEVEASGQCPKGAGWRLYSRGHAPPCWDGKRLDSTNHRDHVGYPKRDPNTGQPKCDAQHPYVIPDFTIQDATLILAGDNIAEWTYSSDKAMNLPGGTTFHADFFMAWSPPVKKTWHVGCLDGLKSCSAGTTGDGQQVNRMDQPYYRDPVTGLLVGRMTNPKRLIPIPGAEANDKLVGTSF